MKKFALILISLSISTAAFADYLRGYIGAGVYGTTKTEGVSDTTDHDISVPAPFSFAYGFDDENHPFSLEIELNYAMFEFDVPNAADYGYYGVGLNFLYNKSFSDKMTGYAGVGLILSRFETEKVSGGSGNYYDTGLVGQLILGGHFNITDKISVGPEIRLHANTNELVIYATGMQSYWASAGVSAKLSL